MQNDMMKRRIIHMMLAMLCMTACGVDVEEVLLSRSDLSLTIKGETIISFDENTSQLGYNTGSISQNVLRCRPPKVRKSMWIWNTPHRKASSPSRVSNAR